MGPLTQANRDVPSTLELVIATYLLESEALANHLRGRPYDCPIHIALATFNILQGPLKRNFTR